MFEPQKFQNETSHDLASLIELPSSALGEPLPILEMPRRLGARVERTPFAASELEFADQHTIDHVNCPACIAQDEALQGVDVDFATMLFRDAAVYWMNLRRQSTSLKPRAHDATQGNLDALLKFFGALRLCDITPGHIRGYQIARLANVVRVRGQEMHPWKRKAGNMLVNHEISVVGQMLTHCRLWQNVRPFYFPLSVKQWSPRTVLTEDEEERLFDVASRHPEASLAYWVACITNNTSAAGLELRGLRLKNLFLSAEGISEIYVPEDSVKNGHRARKVPLNAQAKYAVEECFKRALKLGACEPEHYLFPFRELRNKFDPTRPASRSWLRKSWDKLRKATGFVDLKPHDLRHHCITRLLENDVNPETVIAIAGHVGRKMMEYYAHQRTRVKYAAVLAIEPKPRKRTITAAVLNARAVSGSTEAAVRAVYR
jgi:integrase